MSSTASSSLQSGYVLGLLKGCKSISEMSEQGLLPVSKAQACRLLTHDPAPHRHALTRRLPEAPMGASLAVDFLNLKHEGDRIEGVGRHYASTAKGVQWGHSLVSSALVAPSKDPYLLRCDPYLDARMATATYPRLTASEALLTVVGDLLTAGYTPKCVLADAEFATHLVMRSLKAMKVPFVFRARLRDKVMFEARSVSIKDLAQRFRPGVARWYPKLRRYVKRLSVVIKEVGVVDLLFIWKAQGFGWHLSVLLSTLPGGVQQVMLEAQSRWALEVSHRIRKQNLALSSCSCFSFAAHLLHADLVIRAFNLVCQERARRPGLTWKAAQILAAERLENSLLTGITRVAA